MNSRQKEVIAASLDDEKAVLSALEKNYTTALADIKRNIRELQSNPLTQSKAYQLDFQRQLERQISGILDNLSGKNFASIADYLNTCYQTGFIGAMYDMQGQGVPLILPINQTQVLKAVQKTSDNIKLVNKVGVSTNELKTQVLEELKRGFASDLTYTDIARNISNRGQANMGRSMTIARTEGHRVQSEAKMDSYHAAKAKGADIVKQWDATLDGATRDTHRLLDGQVRELDEDFTVLGASAPYPGGFGDPAEDCNCRCCMLQRARWAVEGETTYDKWNNETGGIIQCTGYDDFKEKYLKAVENYEESGIIERPPFTPAKSIAEAEEYARSMFAKDADYSGAKNLENVNALNQTLTELTSDYPIDTLQSVSTNGRLKSAAAQANGGKIEVKTGYLNNPGEPADWSARIASYPERIADLQARIDSGAYPKDSVKWFQKAIKQMEEEMQFSRWTVSSSSNNPLASTISHEYGHVLADQMFGQINGRHFCADYSGTADIRQMVRETFAEARRTGDIHGISMYANSSEAEFFAECFAAHREGEKLPDYIEKMLKEALKK